jgi:hypothetical protein
LKAAALAASALKADQPEARYSGVEGQVEREFVIDRERDLLDYWGGVD